MSSYKEDGNNFVYVLEEKFRNWDEWRIIKISHSQESLKGDEEWTWCKWSRGLERPLNGGLDAPDGGCLRIRKFKVE